ncbi:biotin carboxyl carrier protein of acetyl-CoA carboxylase [Gracilibacillus boraciitolerans JCM 21714]|uniref:Biotin carboxyl carrier protein of acetyl-CoA carboxylase n=1 Tax=Gracilibacillus boraciitolerans JCM 21714 TaxID=1298598 RepID=W4VCV2_9BACI|nr:acetyl-CoA carboxylase biotin carboxyl carrier protein [Gracilibacillus boraciitolerans]GAE91245.1 biotin carboxyl carrier protein of acetyl-CoA carboxylase [Gracilibacillus boraciitolerans JCM 21714]
MLTVEEINQLIEKIDQSSIDEFMYEEKGAKIKLKKNNGGVVSTSTALQSNIQNTPQPVMESVPKQSAEKEETATQQETETKANYDYEIVSPMVGTFYSSSSPDQPVFVHVGDQVNEDSVVCIVEAMKLFNEIEADVKGTITEILAENGELVEYGQPLFRIKKA